MYDFTDFRFHLTGKVITGNVARLALVETLLLPYTLIKRYFRDKRNKAFAARMYRRSTQDLPENPAATSTNSLPKLGDNLVDNTYKLKRAGQPSKIKLNNLISAGHHKADEPVEERSLHGASNKFLKVKKHMVAPASFVQGPASSIHGPASSYRMSRKKHPESPSKIAPSQLQDVDTDSDQESFEEITVKGEELRKVESFPRQLSSVPTGTDAGAAGTIKSNDSAKMVHIEDIGETIVEVHEDMSSSSESDGISDDGRGGDPGHAADNSNALSIEDKSISVYKKNVTKPPTRWMRFKAWCRRSLARLWYITREEHTLIGLAVPLDEEWAVFTRFQRLLCYYAEIQCSLAVSGLFINTAQTNGTQTAVVALISIILASPAALLLPWMFNTSQTIVSTTVWMYKYNHAAARRSSFGRMTSRASTASSHSSSSQSVGIRGIHDILRSPSQHKKLRQASLNLRADVQPFVAPKGKISLKMRRESWGEQLVGSKSNKVTPIETVSSRDNDEPSLAMPPRPEQSTANAGDKSGEADAHSKSGWMLALSGSKGTAKNAINSGKVSRSRLSSALATRMMRKQKKQIEFNQSVRRAELKHYAEYLSKSRNFMLGLSYCMLALLTCVSLCKFVSYLDAIMLLTLLTSIRDMTGYSFIP